MSFDSLKLFLGGRSKEAVNSHKVHEEFQSSTARELRADTAEAAARTQESGAPVLNGAERAYLEHALFEETEYIKHRIDELESALANREAPNAANAEAEIVALEERQKLLKEHFPEGFPSELSQEATAFLREYIATTQRDLKDRIEKLEKMLAENRAPNTQQTEYELLEAQKELAFLSENLAEKLTPEVA